MSITDELRKEARGLGGYVYTGEQAEHLTAIADRIDAEHQKCIDAMWEDAKSHLSDESLTEQGWIRLPVDGEAPCKQLGEWIEKRGLITGPLDHDGELWHKGDMSASPWGVIEGIVFENGKWFISGHDTSAPWVPADSISHYHAPTVEDVLTEFGIDWEYESDCEDRAALLKEYASKLKLAEGEDA